MRLRDNSGLLRRTTPTIDGSADRRNLSAWAVTLLWNGSETSNCRFAPTSRTSLTGCSWPARFRSVAARSVYRSPGRIRLRRRPSKTDASHPDTAISIGSTAAIRQALRSTVVHSRDPARSLLDSRSETFPSFAEGVAKLPQSGFRLL